MSQHHITTEKDGVEITVTLGWDRPLSGYFMNISTEIEAIDPDTGDTYPDEEYLYCSLSDSNTVCGMHKEHRYFKSKLVEMGLKIPDEMFSILEKDERLNSGSVIKFYTLDNGRLSVQKSE